LTLPHLGDRGIASYNRLNRDLAAFNYVLRVAKPSGACHAHTLFTLNGLFNRANRLFHRHADLPQFILVSPDATMSQADLAILVAQLTAACLAFEERYQHLTEDGRKRAAALHIANGTSTS
jgi:hypothetical protein